jgi:hypothetical protein
LEIFMVQPTARLALEDEIVSQALGSLRFGRSNLFVHSHLGAWLQSAGGPLTRVPKITPILQVPPAPQHFIGRHLELANGIAAISAHRSIEVCGPHGIGKSLFLRQLSHHPQVTTSHPDGILFFTERLEGSDLYQQLFDTFYHTYPDARLSEVDLRLALRDRQALILMDGGPWGAETLLQIQQIMPQSTLVVATVQPQVAALMQTLWLPPLEEAEALQLMHLQGNRPSVEETTIARQLYHQTQGNPREILQGLFLAQRDPQGWVALEQGLPSARWRAIFERLTTAEQWIMALLISLEGGGLTAAQIAAITGPQEPGSSLRCLVQSQMLVLRQGRYWLAQVPPKEWMRQFNTTPWMERVWDYLRPQMQQDCGIHWLEDLSWLWMLGKWLRSTERYEDTLQWGAWLETMLLLGKHWDAWGKLLQWMLQATWQIQSNAVLCPGKSDNLIRHYRIEARVWQQLGVLACCRDDVTTAYDAYCHAIKFYRQAGASSQADLIARARQRLMVDMVPDRPKPRRDTFRVTAARASRRQVNMALGLIGMVTFGVSLTVGLLVQRLWSPEGAIDQSPIPISSPVLKGQEKNTWN